MHGIIQGMIGGTVPAVIMIVWYFLSTERRLTRIETDLTWLKKEIPGCRQPSEDRTQ